MVFITVGVGGIDHHAGELTGFFQPRHGIGHIKGIEEDLITWLQEHEYESLEILRGSMSQRNSPDPSEFERVQYMRAIQSYQPLWSAEVPTA